MEYAELSAYRYTAFLMLSIIVNFTFHRYLTMRFSYLLLLVFLLGCSREDEFKPVYNVPEDFQPFVDSFIDEAASRGFLFEINNLIIEYDASVSSPYCGQCNSIEPNTEVQKVIKINPNIVCWFSDEEQEAFFFHELGHCFLRRLHDDSLLPNGDPKSMMVTSDLSVYAPCLYPIDGEECNNTYKRPYYLDELFDESTSIPDWAD